MPRGEFEQEHKGLDHAGKHDTAEPTGVSRPLLLERCEIDNDEWTIRDGFRTPQRRLPWSLGAWGTSSGGLGGSGARLSRANSSVDSTTRVWRYFSKRARPGRRSKNSLLGSGYIGRL